MNLELGLSDWLLKTVDMNLEFGLSVCLSDSLTAKDS